MKTDKTISPVSMVCQNKSIDSTDLDGEKVMMNLDRGKYYAMNAVGSRIWDIISTTPLSVNKIVEILLNEYDIDAATCEKTVIDFLERVNDEELIKIV